MASKFLERVNLERRALDYVCSKFHLSPPLVGLSMSAIDSWILEVPSTYENIDLDKLKEALVEVSEAARSTADLSDEVFTDSVEIRDADVAMKRLSKKVKKILGSHGADPG